MDNCTSRQQPRKCKAVSSVSTDSKFEVPQESSSQSSHEILCLGLGEVFTVWTSQLMWVWTLTLRRKMTIRMETQPGQQVKTCRITHNTIISEYWLLINVLFSPLQLKITLPLCSVYVVLWLLYLAVSHWQVSNPVSIWSTSAQSQVLPCLLARGRQILSLSCTFLQETPRLSYQYASKIPVSWNNVICILGVLSEFGFCDV